MNEGRAEDWLIKCTKALRKLLPVGKYLVSHAPQAPYFMGKRYYKNGGYVKVNEEVGDLIDWYNIQFYNQGDTTYDNYDKLFIESEGTFNKTAVKNIVDILGKENTHKVVVGKPVTKQDASNTGWVQPGDLGAWAAKANLEFGWEAGLKSLRCTTFLQRQGEIARGSGVYNL